MHNIVEVDTFSANVSALDDGDAASAANFTADTQQLSNRTRYLYNRAPGAIGVSLPVNLNNIAYNCHADDSAGVHFVLNVLDLASVNIVYGVYQSDIGNTGKVGWDVTSDLIAAGMLGGTISSIVAYVDGDLAAAAPPHAALPGTMPILRLRTVNRVTLATAIAITATDASANQAAYDAAHTITCAGPVVIAADTRYFVEFLGEAVGAAEAGFTIGGINVNVTPA